MSWFQRMAVVVNGTNGTVYLGKTDVLLALSKAAESCEKAGDANGAATLRQFRDDLEKSEVAAA